MPVVFGQEEPVNQTRAPLQAAPAQPDKSLASDSFSDRKKPERALDIRLQQAPIPFYPELDTFAPEGYASSINSVLTGQQQQGTIPRIRGTAGDASYPRISHEDTYRQSLQGPIRGFKITYAPSLGKLVEAEPMDHGVSKLHEMHIASVMAEERHGYRRPDPENAAIVTKPKWYGGSRLYGRNQGIARQQNPAHLKKPRFGLPLSVPALPGTDYAGYYINNGRAPEQRRLPDQT